MYQQESLTLSRLNRKPPQVFSMASEISSLISGTSIFTSEIRRGNNPRRRCSVAVFRKAASRQAFASTGCWDLGAYTPSRNPAKNLGCPALCGIPHKRMQVHQQTCTDPLLEDYCPWRACKYDQISCPVGSIRHLRKPRPCPVAQWRPFFLFLGKGSPLNSTNQKGPFLSHGHWASENGKTRPSPLLVCGRRSAGAALGGSREVESVSQLFSDTIFSFFWWLPHSKWSSPKKVPYFSRVTEQLRPCFVQLVVCGCGWFGFCWRLEFPLADPCQLTSFAFVLMLNPYLSTPVHEYGVSLGLVGNHHFSEGNTLDFGPPTPLIKIWSTAPRNLFFVGGMFVVDVLVGANESWLEMPQSSETSVQRGHATRCFGAPKARGAFVWAAGFGSGSKGNQRESHSRIRIAHVRGKNAPRWHHCQE